ncbi:MAG: hypothetical protein KBD16_01035 [Candidatus Pacebacteria bacterium]|nr:hypothetical protein [Candidatus Paceibacterota bacterium]
MSIPEYLGVISGLLLIAGFIPYLYEVVTRSTIPNRASWFIWSLSTAIILFGVHETGTTEAIWVPIADALGCFLVFLLSLFFGTGGWAKTDRISLAISAASILLWWYTGSALIALLTNLIIYTSGYIPTIKKSILDPQSESLTAWTFFFLGIILNLVTVAIGTDTGFAVWVYPIVLVITVGTLYFLLIRRCIFKKRFARA